MPKTIEAVYEKGIIKPLTNIKMKEGKIVKIVIIEDVVEKRKRFLKKFKPINLGRNVTMKEIEELRNESVFRY